MSPYPDRYEVRRTDAGGFLYKYIFLWKSNKTEVLSQVVEAVREGIPLAEDWKERIDQDFQRRKR